MKKPAKSVERPDCLILLKVRDRSAKVKRGPKSQVQGLKSSDQTGDFAQTFPQPLSNASSSMKVSTLAEDTYRLAGLAAELVARFAGGCLGAAAWALEGEPPSSASETSMAPLTSPKGPPPALTGAVVELELLELPAS